MKKYLYFLALCLLFSCSGKDTLPKNYLKIAMKAEPCWMDPRKGVSMTASPIHAMLFEGLVRMSSKGEIETGIAASYTVSKDRCTYTFYLSPEARFSNGDPITAPAFVHSFRQILSPAFLSKDAYLLYPIRGAKKAHLHGGSVEEIGVYAKNAMTLVIELHEPYPPFLEVLTLSSFVAVHQHTDQHNPNWSNQASEDFITSGPFLLESWKRGSEIKLKKNPFYYNKQSVLLDGIAVQIIPNEMSYLRLFMLGEVDFIGSPISPLPVSAYPTMKKNNQIHSVSIGGTKILSFNVAKKPLENRSFRRALNYAIHRKEMVDKLTYLDEPIATRVIPPAIFTDDSAPFFEDHHTEMAVKEWNQFLKEQGWKSSDVPTLTLTYLGSGLNDLLVQHIKESWKNTLGLSVQLEKVPLKTVLAKMQSKNYEICLCAYVSELKNPINIFERFLSKTNLRNYPGWESPRYTTAFHRCKSQSAPETHFTKLERVLMEEVPFSPLYHYKYAYAVSKRVRNIHISPLGHIFFDQVWLDHTL